MPKRRFYGQGAYSSALFPLLVLAVSLASVPTQAACTLRAGEAVPSVVLPVRHEARHEHTSYYAGLLQLAMDKTEEGDGPCRVKIHDEIKPQARRYRDLERKAGTDVIDATSTAARSERFLPIPVPLLKGLMGYRISLIRTEDRDRFTQIKTLEDLKPLVAGQGEGWSDVDIFRTNDLKVVTADQYEALYRMLKEERFDYFPRGAQEVLDEFANFDTDSLMIEPNLVIAYPSPVYFHVHKDNTALAERIETGLKIAVEDGSFDEFFYAHPLVRDVFDKLRLEERTFLYLCDPDQQLPETLSDSDTWLKPWPEDTCGSTQSTSSEEQEQAKTPAER